MSEFSLMDRIICAAAQAWKDDGEVLATGIGIVPRLAASLCMSSTNPDLMMTDSEAWLVSEPVPIGPRGDYQLAARSLDGFFAHLRQRLERQAPRDGRADPDRPLRPGQHLDGRQRLPPAQSRMMLGVRGFPGQLDQPRQLVFRAATTARRCLSPAKSIWWPRSATTRRAWRAARASDDIDIRLHLHQPVRDGLWRPGSPGAHRARCTRASRAAAGAGSDRLRAAHPGAIA